jgi:hypothetical protein
MAMNTTWLLLQGLEGKNTAKSLAGAAAFSL